MYLVFKYSCILSSGSHKYITTLRAEAPWGEEAPWGGGTTGYLEHFNLELFVSARGMPQSHQPATRFRLSQREDDHKVWADANWLMGGTAQDYETKRYSIGQRHHRCCQGCPRGITIKNIYPRGTEHHSLTLMMSPSKCYCNISHTIIL